MNKILCLIWVHIFVRDFFIYSKSMDKSRLCRQCMTCNKIIHYKYPLEKWDTIEM
jgi:hypothetical protein